MKHRRLFMMLCAVVMMFTYISSLPVFAAETEPQEQSVMTEESVTSAGLIIYYTLSISSGTKTLYLTASTNAADTMAKVGFENITIQRSSNGSSGWTDEKSLADDLAQNALSHKKSKESVSVTGGYYYRVVLDHYAKETGWFFPSSERITNYSNVIWVPA